MPIGCAAIDTQAGQIITGSRSTRARIISKERLPEPMTIEARNSIDLEACARVTLRQLPDGFVNAATARLHPSRQGK